MTPTPSLPSISVALCTYNGERHLLEQLDSIARQTRLPLELVVCDDRSQDSTLALLNSFADTAPFPVHIHRNEQQLGSTRNFDKATRLCRGDYIALCDQDDRWLETRLASLGAILEEDTSISMVFSDAQLIDEHSQLTGQTLWDSLRFPAPLQARFLQQPATVLFQRPVVTGATMLFRRSLLSRYNAIPQSWVHDAWITWMSVLWSRPGFLTNPLTFYRVHAAQQLGVGKTSPLARLQEIRQRQRGIYAQAASAFADLLHYVQDASPELQHWVEPIGEVSRFFAVRADAPRGLLSRAAVLWRARTAYQRLYGRFWRPWLRDLPYS